jgi:hypothetical protein
LPEAPPRRGQFLFMSNRKAFNFFRSYYEVANELTDKDRLAFYDALMLEQFTGRKSELKGMAKFAYISQQHSIDSQINGFNQRLKRGDISLEPLSSLPPMAGDTLPPKAQEEGEEEEKGKDISQTPLIDIEKIFLEKTESNWTESYAKKEAEKFFNFYGSKGWKVGKEKMKSLPHAIGGWISRCDKPETKDSPKEETEREFRLRMFNERNGL